MTRLVSALAWLALGHFGLTDATAALGDAPATTPPVLSRFEFEEPQMGVPFRIVLYAAGESDAQAAAQAAFARVAELNQIMSDYETDSELNELSRTSGRGQQVPVSTDLWKVLERAQFFAERSDGAFDVTVGPAVVLWRKARRVHQMPDAARLEEARRAIGYRKMRLDPEKHAVELVVRGMKLDLGGIAKGYALDEELKVLRGKGITRALVSGGGDLAVSEPPPGQEGWRIELAPLDAVNAPSAKFVRLANAALSTSGDTFQRLEIDGRRYSHVVDPRTGIGLTDHSLVTIIAPDATTADGLSKVLSVLGPERGIKLLEQFPAVEARVARQPNERIEMSESPGFKRFYVPAPSVK